MTAAPRISAIALLTLALSGCRSDGSTEAAQLEASGDSVDVATGGDEPAAAAEAPAGATSLDRAVATAVAMALVEAADVDARHFRVSARDGTVELESTSGSATEVARARDAAANVPGVTEVRLASQPPAGDNDVPPVPHATAATVAAAIALGTPRDDVPELAPSDEGQPGAVSRAASGDRPRTYRVRAGDSLSVIASRTMSDGNAWQRIYELNRNVIGPNPERLVEGMELRIPQD